MGNLYISYFDRDGSGRVSVEEFLRGLKTGMSYDRKMLVRQVTRGIASALTTDLYCLFM